MCQKREKEAKVEAAKETEKKEREQAALVRVALLTPPRQLLNRFKFGQLPRRTCGLPPGLGVDLLLLFPGALGDLLFLFAAGRRAQEKLELIRLWKRTGWTCSGGVGAAG